MDGSLRSVFRVNTNKADNKGALSGNWGSSSFKERLEFGVFQFTPISRKALPGLLFSVDRYIAKNAEPYLY